MTIGLGMSMPEASSRAGSSSKTLNLNFLGGNFDRRITFSRGTSATQYGSDGYLKYAPSNQLTYSQAFNDAVWTKTGGFLQTNLLTQSQNFENAAYTKTSTNVQSNLLTYSEQFDNAAWTKVDSVTQSNLLTYSNQTDNNTAWSKTNSFIQTNLLTYSNTFSDASWLPLSTKNIAASSAISPDGTANATVLTDSSTTAFEGIQKNLTIAVGTETYTTSIYVLKTTGGTSPTFGINLGISGGTIVVTQPRLNTDTGVIIGGVATVTSVGAWWRLTCSVTNNGTAGNVNLAVSFYSATAAYNSSSDVVTATGSATIYGAQITRGSIAGDYQATTSTALPILYTDYTGALRARKLCEAGTTGTHYLGQLTTNSNGIYTLSLTVKAGERGYIYLDMSDNTTGDASVQINVSAGTYSSNAVTGSWTNPSASIISLGNGWYRCSLTATRNAGTQTVCYVYASSSGGPNYAGDGSSGIYIADAQLVAGTQPGDVVETTSVALPVQYKAPDGTTTAEQLVTTVASNPSIQQSITGPQTGLPLTFSYYVRAGTSTEAIAQLYINSGTPTTNVAVTAVILSGPGTLDMSSAAGGVARITGLSTTTWTRVAVTGVTTATAGNFTAYIKNRITGSVVGDSIYIWGTQLTYGLVAGDYRATTSASLPILYTAPDGTLTAEKITEVGSSVVQRYIGRSVGAITAANTVYTYSLYAKAAERTFIYIDGVRKDGTFWSAIFNLTTSSVVTSVNTVSTQVTPLANGWCRVAVSVNTLSGASVDSLAVSLYNGSTTNYAGDGSSGVYFWGFQVTQGAFAGNYQPTTTVAVPIGYPDPFGGSAAQKFCEDTTTGAHFPNRSSATIGVPQVLSVYAKAGERTQLCIQLGNIGIYFNLVTGTIIFGVGGVIEPLANGWYRCSCATTPINQNVQIYTVSGGLASYTGDGTSGIYIFGAQLDNGYVTSPYVATTGSAYYGPRLDYDPTSHIQSNLVLYPQDFERTPSWSTSNAFVQQNLLTYSEQLDNAIWSKTNLTVTPNAATAPDGTLTADLITTTTTAFTTIANYANTTASSHTVSIFVMAGTVNSIDLGLYDGTNFGSGSAVIVSGPGTVTQQVGSLFRLSGLSTMQWTRVAVTRTTASAGSGLTLNVYPRNSTVSTASDTIYLWGAQLVQGSAPGDYVRTVGAARAVLYPNPWGKLLARKLCENTVASTQHFVTQSVALGVGTFTLSAYLKAGERTKAMFNRNEIGGFSLQFDLVTGTINLVNGFTNPTIQSIGGGWYRVACNLTLAVGATIGFALETLDAGGLASYTGDGSSGIYIFGAQVTQTDAPQNVYNPDAYQNLVYPSTDFSSSNWSKPNAYIQTNLLTYSQNFDNAAWTKFNSSVTANSTTDPNGGSTADSFVESTDATASFHSLTQNITGLTAGTYTFSAYVKAGSRTFFEISPTSGYGVNFNLTTGAINFAYGAGATGTIISVGSGWYRLTVTASISSASSTVTLLPGGAAGVTSYIGNGSVSAYIWGAQLVRGTVPGDYKATTSAALPVLYQAPDGTLTGQKLCSTAATVVHAAVAALNLVPASTYTFSAYFKAGELTTVNLQRGSNSGGATFNLTTGVVSGVSAGFTAGIYPVSNNWFRCWITVTNPIPDSFAVSLYNAGNTNLGDGTSGAYIWGPNLNEGVYPHDYTPTSTAAITQCGLNGLLIEEQRANLLLQSNDFFTSWAPTNVTRTLNATLSPEGVVNGVKIEATTTSTAILYNQVTATSTAHTFSVYVKQGTGPTSVNTFGLRNVTTLTNLVFGTFNYTTGQFAYSVGTTGVTVTYTGNGWWRLSFSASSGITVGDLIAGYVGFSGGAFTAGDFLYAYGAQLEAGAFATSYIPTVASQVTRAADSASVNTLTPWFNAAAGTVYSQVDTIVSTSPKLFSRLGPTISGGIGPYATSTNVILDKNGTGSLITASGALVTPNTRVAWGYDGTNVAMSVNGGAVATAAGALGTPADALYIGRDSNVVTNLLNGHVKSLRYYPTRLPNATLQSITA